MNFDAKPGEQYTIRRKVFKIFGAAFHIYDPAGKVIAFCKQEAFKLKEDIRLYTDETCSQELLVMQARSVIDFGATYDVTLPGGATIGSLRRKGLTSSFIKDSWLVFDPSGKQIATLAEEGSTMAVLRRYVEFVAFLSPQKFNLRRTVPGSPNESTLPPIATFRTHFNPFIYRLSISVQADDTELDDLMILASGCLISAIEGRQSGG